MSLWEERAARNEALFREVNEQMRSLSGRPGPGTDEMLFICECADEHCAERVAVPAAVYEAVRSNPRRFLILPGHDNDVERVVDQADGYAIVEKEGVAGRVAEERDPRPP